MLSEQKKKAEEKMSKALDVLRKEFTTLRTGRASLGMLDGIMVDYYGTPTPLNQVAEPGGARSAADHDPALGSQRCSARSRRPF